MIDSDTFQDCANNEVNFGCHSWTKGMHVVKEVCINKVTPQYVRARESQR